MKMPIYSDSFASYQVNHFDTLGFRLNKVNQSVWLGHNLFHINTVEVIWSQIRRIPHDFSGLNFKILDHIEENDGNTHDYIDNWI